MYVLNICLDQPLSPDYQYYCHNDCDVNKSSCPFFKGLELSNIDLYCEAQFLTFKMKALEKRSFPKRF